MKLKTWISLIFVTFIHFSNGQNDSIICDASFKITEGIYLNYADFRRNAPISRSNINTKQDKDQLEIFGKILAEKTFSYNTNSGTNTFESKNAWGYYQNNTLYINFNGEFFRVPVFGSINYFVATVEVISPGFYNPGYGGMMGSNVRTKELRNFLMNFYDGRTIPFTTEDAENLISRDSELYKEFKSLKRKQQKEQISRYIRKYNELHPVYFLK